MTLRSLPDYTCQRDGCDTTFHPPWRHQKYCSRVCADLARRKVSEVVCKRDACRREFTVRKRKKIFCSRECADLARGERRPIKTCPQCSRSFSVRPSKVEIQTYCSNECARAVRAVPEIECPGCRQSFKPKQHRQQYCSRECSRVSSRRGRPRAALRAAITCPPCGKDFHPRRKDQRFCSRECGFEGQRRNGGAPAGNRPARRSQPRTSTPRLAPAAPPSIDIPAAPTQLEVLIWRPKSWGGPQRVTTRSAS